MNNAVIIFLMFLMLCSCNSTDESTLSNADAEHALDAYNRFLNGEMYYLEGEQKVTLAPVSEFYYTILDMNDDGIPELATTMAIHQQRDTNFVLQASHSECAIFSYEDGSIIKWYSGSTRYSFEILSNKALLYEYESGNQYNYDYIELNDDGSTKLFRSYYKYCLDPDNKSPWRYYTDDGTEQRELSEAEWKSSVDSYLELKDEDIQWSLNPRFSSK